MKKIFILVLLFHFALYKDGFNQVNVQAKSKLLTRTNMNY